MIGGPLQDLGGDFRAGGGQMGTCLDAARIMQLVLNKGRWPNAKGDGATAVLSSQMGARG